MLRLSTHKDSRSSAISFQILLAILLTAAIAWASDRGLFDSANGILTDLFYTLMPAATAPNGEILLVDSPPQAAADWPRVVEQLRSLRAKRIVFTFAPGNLPATARAEWAARGDVLLAEPAWLNRRDPDRWVVAAPPAPADGIGSGLALVFPADRGIHRRHTFSVTVDSIRRPTLEMLVAQSEHGLEWVPPVEHYLINFRGGLAGLPKVELDRVADGQIVADLVAGRTVLLGITDPSANQRLNVPFDFGNGWITELEYHGFATRTALVGELLRESDVRQTTILVVGLLTFVIALGAFAGSRFVIVIVAAVIVAVPIGAALLYFYADVALPVSELLAALFAFLTVAAHRHWTAKGRVLERLVRNLSLRVRERLQPISAADRAGPWAQVATMASQLLDLNRSVFLETIPGEPRVREVVAVGCDTSDIAERRRDYRRAPFAEAMAAGEPTSTRRPLLTTRRADEDQFLAPLIYGGNLLGFWAFSVDRRQWIESPGFMPLAKAFIEQASDYLADLRQRTILLGGVQSRGRYLANPMEQASAGSERELEPLLELEHRRLVLLEEILGGVTTATIVYDAFGRVLQVNQHMVKLLKDAQLSTTDTSPLDLITRLTDAPPERVRHYLRHIVLEHGLISVPTRSAADGKRFLLYISSIEHMPQRGRESVEPLSMFRAILCELIDITAFERLYAMREVVSEHMGHRLRNSLAAMFAATDLLGDARLSQEQRGGVLDNLKRSLQTSREAFDAFEKFLDLPLVADIAERYPVDARAAVLDGVAAIRAEAERMQVRIETDIPEFVSLVIAGNQELITLTRTILLLLTQDAQEGGVARVVMREQEDAVVIEYTNNGFGLPDDRLQEYLHGSEEPQSSAFRMIRLGFKDTERWGGHFEVESPQGQGFRFKMTLRKVA